MYGEEDHDGFGADEIVNDDIVVESCGDGFNFAFDSLQRDSMLDNAKHKSAQLCSMKKHTEDPTSGTQFSIALNMKPGVQHE